MCCHSKRLTGDVCFTVVCHVLGENYILHCCSYHHFSSTHPPYLDDHKYRMCASPSNDRSLTQQSLPNVRVSACPFYIHRKQSLPGFECHRSKVKVRMSILNYYSYTGLNMVAEAIFWLKTSWRKKYAENAEHNIRNHVLTDYVNLCIQQLCNRCLF